MKQLKLLKSWKHDGVEYAEDTILDFDGGDDAFVEDLISKGIAELHSGKITKAAKAEPDADDEQPLTRADIKAMVAEAGAKAAADADIKVKRPHVAVGKDRSEDDPKRGYKSHSEFLLDVKAAYERQGQGLPIPERVRPLIAGKAAGSDEQSVAADQYGGILLPIDFMPELLRVEPEADILAGRTRQVPMTAVEVKIAARVDKNHSSSVAGGLTFSRREEIGTIAGTRIEFEQISLHAHSLYGATFATEEILSDSPISFTQLLATSFADQFVYHMMDEKINGTGAGEYLGVLNSPALVTVPKETSQTAATIVYENIINMRARCWNYGNAVWIANHDTLPQLLVMGITVGVAGIPLWQPGSYGGATQDRPDTLLGRPIFFSEHPAVLGTVGDIILADWSQYLEGTLQPMASAESMHVRFLTHERAFKFWTRNDGRPWWTAELTPKGSSPTLSPFVVLATRA